MQENIVNEKAWWNAKGGKKVQQRKPAGCGRATHRALMTAGAIVGAVLLIGAMVAPLGAQSYPDKPIRFILPYAPGGTTDIVGRIIGPKLAERLGQSVVPENRAGGGGNVGTEFAAKARPDGYTIVLVNPDMTTGPSLYKKLSYDLIKDFVPISLVAQTHLVLLVKPSLPVKTLKELVEYAKANPGKLNYGSAGIGTTTHLAPEFLQRLVNINMGHAPYKGAGPSLIGLLGGEVDIVVCSIPTALSQIQAGKVRALAVLGKERALSLPNVPTAKEAGIDNFVVFIWYGMLAPAGTSRDIINRLNGEWIKIAAMPDTAQKMLTVGSEPLSSSPEQFSELLKAEIARWAKVIKEANIPPFD